MRIPRVHDERGVFQQPTDSQDTHHETNTAHKLHQDRLSSYIQETTAVHEALTPDYHLVSAADERIETPSGSFVTPISSYKTDEAIDRIAQGHDDVLVSFVEEAFSFEESPKDPPLGSVETSQEHNPFTDRLLKTYSIVVANSSSNIRVPSKLHCTQNCEQSCAQLDETGQMCPTAQARIDSLSQQLEGALITSKPDITPPLTPAPALASTSASTQPSNSTHHARKLAQASFEEAFSILWSIDGVLGVCLLDLDSQTTIFHSETWSDDLTVEVAVAFPMMKSISSQVQDTKDIASLEDIILTTTSHIQIVRMIPSFSRRCVVAFLSRSQATPALARWAVQEACTRLAEIHNVDPM